MDSLKRLTLNGRLEKVVSEWITAIRAKTADIERAVTPRDGAATI
jgi:hypothetical protein